MSLTNVRRMLHLSTAAMEEELISHSFVMFLCKVQDQNGWGLRQPDLVGGIPVHGGGLEPDDL